MEKLVTTVVTVQIYYYIPDHRSLIQEFLWQTHDYVPKIPRVHSFLNFWKNEIDATINQVNVAWSENRNFRPISSLYNL